MFPIVWSHLRKEQQIGLAKPIIHLLAREYHQRQAFARPNVMQARNALPLRGLGLGRGVY